MHHRDDVKILYVSIKEGGRGLANIENSVDLLIQEQNDCIKKRRGRLIKATGNNTGRTDINRIKIAREVK